MKSGIKIAVSLIITTVLFAAVTIASSFGLFSSIEKTFYEPAKLKIIRAKLDATADYSNEYIDNLLSYFGESDGGFMADPAVLAFTEKSTPDSAIASVYKLMENVPALSGIRIIGSEGRRVYYSYFKTDSRTDGQRKNYADYNSLRTQSGRAEISYPLINAAQNSNNKDSSPIIFFDDIDQRILFSYRLKSEENAFSVIFYVNPLDFKLYLVTKKLIAINENIRLAASDNGSLGGFIYGLPEIGANMLIPSIIKYAAAAGIYPANILSLPHYVRILLFICTFITACLIVLIIFSLRKDDDVVIRNTIKRFQFELLNDFFEKDMERQQIAGMLEAQKDGLSAKIKKSLGARGKKYGKELDLMLERSWSDIISALSGGKAYSVQPIKPDIDMTEIRRMFEELLQGANLHSAPAPAKDVSAKTVTFSNSSADDVEELEDAEPVEDFDDVEELDEVEPVEDADDVEELEEIEPLEDAGKTEDAQGLENADDVEDIEELEEIGADSQEENTGNDDKADALKTLEDENDVKTDNAESFENEKLHEDVELVEDSKVPENADTTEELEEIAPENTDSDNKAENTAALEHNIDCTEEFLQEDTENLAQETKAKSAVEDSELREEAKFGMPEQLNKNENEITDNSVSDNFLVVAPIEFLTRQDLDQPLNQEQTEEIIPEEHSDNPETLDYIDSADSENNDFSAVEPLDSDKSSAPFSFTSFASNTVNVPLLTPEVIIQGDDGVFTISEDISGDNSGNVNKELKNLVDNVLSRH